MATLIREDDSANAIRIGPAILVEDRCIADIVTSIAVAGLSVDRV
jgi:hypothetical protein